MMLGMTLSAPFALWLGINLFINLGLPAVISYQPERLRVTYSWARMGMPGEVEVHDLRIVAQGPLDQWALEVDRATAVIDLLPLLDRTFSAHQIRGTGGTLRYRVRIPSADRPPPGAPADDINPPIPELQNPPSPAPEELYAPPNNPWHVALTDVTLDGLREVWFGSVRYEGNSSVSGELAYTLLEHLGVRQAVLKMTDGAITVGGGEMLHGVHGRLDLAIEGMNPAVNAGIEAFGFITAKVSMAGKVQDLRFLDFYLGEVPWVQLTGGEGDLEVEALLDHGRFADGTTLTANVRAVEGHWFDYVARGDALLRLLVSSPAAIPETAISSEASAVLLATVQGIPALVLQLVIVVLSPYFFLVDGRRFLAWIAGKLPLSLHIRTMLVASFRGATSAVVLASVAAAAVQAACLLVGYLALGVPAALFAGGAAFVLAWVPTVGTVPVWASAAVYLYLQGSPTRAVIMVVIGLVVGLVDNVVRPLVLRGRQEMHPMVSLLAVIGGLAILGVPGLFLGPLVASMAIAVMEIWPAVATYCGIPVSDGGDAVPEVPMIDRT